MLNGGLIYGSYPLKTIAFPYVCRILFDYIMCTMTTKPRILKFVSILILLLIGYTSFAQTCALTVTSALAGACDVNGTPFNLADDTYPITVNATVVDGGIANQFTVSDGTNTFGPFDYATGGTIILPPDGNTYTLTYADVDDPTCSNTATVSQSPCCLIDVSSTIFPETMPSAANGEIVLCFNSGVEPFNIEVTPVTNASIYQVPGSCLHNYIIAGLPQDDYTISITDANDCTALLASQTIAAPDCTGFMLSSIAAGSTSCIDATDGTMDITFFDPGNAISITVDVGNGIPPVTFTDFEDGLQMTDLPAGDYNVALFDQNGCEVTYLFNPVVISEPTPVQLSTTITTNVTAVGEEDGTIQVCVSGANDGFQVTTNPVAGTITANSACPGEESFLISGLPEGSYEVITTDPMGCADILYINISDPNCTLQLENINITNIDCGGTNTGILDVSISGGEQPYSISLDGGVTFFNPQASPDFMFNDLLAGSYDVIIKDNSDTCAISLNNHVIITETPAINLEATVSNATTFGGLGSASFCINGGTANYAVSVNPNTGTLLPLGASSECEDSYILAGLLAGTYEITVIDDLGCSEIFEIEVLEPSCPGFMIDEVEIDSVNCYGANDGSITISLTGGLAPFTYEISGLQIVTTSANPYTFNGLDNGTYEILATDANGCFAPYILEVKLAEPNPIHTVVSIVPPCEGDDNGIICLVPEAGTADDSSDYTYTVVNSDQDDQPVMVGPDPDNECGGDYHVLNVEAGEYHVELVDANGCIAHTIITVSEVVVSVFPEEVLGDCSTPGIMAGAIDISYGGGTPDYTFNWSNGPTTEDIQDLDAGVYTVTVTDARGCEGVLPITVADIDVAPIFNTAATCLEQNAGAIIVSIQEGTGVPAYDLSWSGDGLTGNILDNSSSNITYQVTITDGRGCTAEGTVAVPEYDMVVDLTPTATCEGQSNGVIGTTLTEGIPTIDYIWSNGSMDENVMDLAPGDYTITVTDINGCEAIETVTVEEYQLSISFEVEDVCVGSNTGSITAVIENSEGAVSYDWSNGGITNPLQGIGAETYTVDATDALGCTVSGSTSLQEFDSPTAEASEDVSIIQGQSTTLSVNGTGGTTPYNFQWSPVGGDNPTGSSTNVNPSETLTYTVQIIDANGCFATDTVLVTVFPEPIVVMPTAFSPNGDNNNDVYEPFIPNANADVLTFQVFDRWGKLLHNDATTMWDGEFKGKEQPVGTYVYVVEYIDLLNQQILLKGHFNLIR
jgi:gliding motility-associated-like protein